MYRKGGNAGFGSCEYRLWPLTLMRPFILPGTFVPYLFLSAHHPQFTPNIMHNPHLSC